MNVSTKYNKFDSIPLVGQSVSPEGSTHQLLYIDKDKIEGSSAIYRCLKPFSCQDMYLTANTCNVCISNIVC